MTCHSPGASPGQRGEQKGTHATNGGGGGIRTHEARKGLPAFEAGPFNPSGTPPQQLDISRIRTILALSSRAQRGICIWVDMQIPHRQGNQGFGMTSMCPTRRRLTLARGAGKVVFGSGDGLEEDTQAAVPD